MHVALCLQAPSTVRTHFPSKLVINLNDLFISAGGLLSVPGNSPSIPGIPANMAAQFANASFMPNVINPLKRKHEDDNYEHT